MESKPRKGRPRKPKAKPPKVVEAPKPKAKPVLEIVNVIFFKSPFVLYPEGLRRTSGVTNSEFTITLVPGFIQIVSSKGQLTKIPVGNVESVIYG